MSARTVGWVLRSGPTPGAEGLTLATARRWRAVLVVIADAANSDGEHAHPGLDNIVAQSLYSRSQVLKTTAELEEAGWIRTVERAAPGRATVFDVLMDRVSDGDPSRVPIEDLSDAPTGLAEEANGSRGEGQRVSKSPSAPITTSGVVTRGTAAPVPGARPVLALATPSDGLSPLQRALAVTGGAVVKPKARDEVWDAVMEACDIDQAAISKSARGAYNAAVRDLKAMGATPEQIAVKAANWLRYWSTVTITPTALVRRWAEIPDRAPSSPSMSALERFAAGGDR